MGCEDEEIDFDLQTVDTEEKGKEENQEAEAEAVDSAEAAEISESAAAHTELLENSNEAEVQKIEGHSEEASVAENESKPVSPIAESKDSVTESLNTEPKSSGSSNSKINESPHDS